MQICPNCKCELEDDKSNRPCYDMVDLVCPQCNTKYHYWMRGRTLEKVVERT